MFGTLTLETAKRVITKYNEIERCVRVLEVRPVEVEIPDDHAYACRVKFSKSDETTSLLVMADGPSAAIRHLARRFKRSIKWAGVWMFADEEQANETPALAAVRDGAFWTIEKPNPAVVEKGR